MESEDNYIQNFHLGRYIISYMVGNYVSAMRQHLLNHLFVKGLVFCTKGKLRHQRKTTMSIRRNLLSVS